MKTKTLFSFVAIAVISFSISAQDPNNYNPPSPEAAALSKSINFPAGTNTGVPDIRIPLYNVEVGGVNLPVELSYHAGGFRINEQSGPVGLGWTMGLLELQVTRQINGMDDFINFNTFAKHNGYYFNDFGPSTALPDIKGLLELTDNKRDYEPDRFQFRLLNKSGTFYFQKRTNGPPTIVTIPTQDIFIEPITPISPMPGGSQQSGGFKITDTDGTVYIFNRIETTTTNYESPGGEIHITSWKCSKITNASKTDEILFHYEPRDNQYSFTHDERIEVLDDTYPPQAGVTDPAIIFPDDIEQGTLNRPIKAERDILNRYSTHQLASPKYSAFSLGEGNNFNIVWCTSPPPVIIDNKQWCPTTVWDCDECASGEECINGRCWAEVSGNTLCPQVAMTVTYPADWKASRTLTAVSGLALEKITFRSGEIDFEYDNTKRHLESIGISNYQNDGSGVANVKNIAFFQREIRDFWDQGRYITPSGERAAQDTWYLDAVRLDWTEKYSFAYRDYWLFHNHAKGSDAWGAVNSYTTDFARGISVPQNRVFSTDFTCGPEDGLDYVIGMNSITPEENGMMHGILTKITYPTGGYTQFAYAPNKFSNHRKNYVVERAGGLRIESMQYYDGRNPVPAWRKIYKYGISENGVGILRSAPSVSYLDGESNYDYTQYVYYNTTISERKRTFVPNSITDLFYTSGAPVHYTEVAEYTEEGGRATGKTVYYYDQDAYNGYNPYYRISGTNLTVRQTDWHMGKLKAEIQYKFISRLNENGELEELFDTLKVKQFTHEPYETSGVSLAKAYLQSLGKSEPPPPGGGLGTPPHLSTGDFYYFPYSLTAGVMLLTAEKEIWKEGDKKLSKTTSYHYGNSNSGMEHLQPTRIITTQSDGAMESRLAYAPDFVSQSGFLGKLKTNNMLSLPVEQVTLNNGNVVAAQFFQYRDDDSGLVDKVFSIETSQPISMNGFKFSNIGTFTKDPAYREKSTFTYNSLRKPITIAPTDNIPIAYIWGYKDILPIAKAINATNDQVYYNGFEDDISASQGEAESHTGNRYQTSSFTVPFTASSGTHYVSYWYFSNGAWQFSGLQSYSNGFTISAARIDDVRVYPCSAQMITYTYKPLVGITSMTDASNITSYYNYDALGRLKTIRDHKGDIVRTYTYHYR